MPIFNLYDENKKTNFSKQVDLLFELWSTLPNGKSYRKDSTTKIYKRVYTYVQNLRQGLPLVSTSRGSVDFKYLQSLKKIINTFSNNDKRLVSFLHQKWKTKEIENILIKINSELLRPISLDLAFWMPFTATPQYSTEFSAIGFSYFSLYALNENIGNRYNNFVNEFYQASFSRHVSDAVKQKEAILLEDYVLSKQASLSTLKNLFSWYLTAREEQFVRKVDTMTHFIHQRANLEANRTNLNKSRQGTNKNAYVSEKFRAKLKDIEEYKLW